MSQPAAPVLLIVDDDRDIRNLLADHLEQHGFRTLKAANGKAMQAALDAGPVNLVVLDLNLPDEDGLRLCRSIRAASLIPVIILTARGDPIDRILGLEMGADDYMAKPFEPRELVARIRTVLRRARWGQGYGRKPPRGLRRLVSGHRHTVADGAGRTAGAPVERGLRPAARLDPKRRQGHFARTHTRPFDHSRHGRSRRRPAGEPSASETGR